MPSLLYDLTYFYFRIHSQVKVVECQIYGVHYQSWIIHINNVTSVSNFWSFAGIIGICYKKINP